MLVFPHRTVNVYKRILKLKHPIETMMKSEEAGDEITYDWAKEVYHQGDGSRSLGESILHEVVDSAELRDFCRW